MKAQQLLKQAQQFNPCSRFNNCSSITELIDLMLTPQGVEFCTKNNYPSIEAWDGIDKTSLHAKGIYVNAGEIELKNRAMVFLFGKTAATLTYDDPSKRHQIILMGGTSAKVVASGYAVVAITNAGGVVDTEVKENAVIL